MQELIRRTALGDKKALGLLYEVNAGLIHRIAVGYSAMCEQDIAVTVDDLEQIAFFAVAEAAISYDPTAGKSWAGWLVYFLRIQMNKALGRRNGRFLRPDSGAVSLDEPIDSEDDGSATRLDELADDTLPDIDEALLSDEIVRGVRAAIQRLPDDRQRAAVVAVDLDGLTLAAAADRMNSTPWTVRGDRARAFKSLRRDPELIALRQAYGIEPPSYWQYKGVHGFYTDWTSATEGAALYSVAVDSEEYIDKTQ